MLLIAILAASVAQASSPSPSPETAGMSAQLAQAAPQLAAIPGVVLQGYPVEGRTSRPSARA